MASEITMAAYGWSADWKIGNQSPKNHSQSHLPPDHPQPGPKILWGVTSTYDSHMELRRRGPIRATYLSFYKINDHFVENPDRICSLADLMDGKVHFDRCQLVYTFVMGGNPDGPEEFVDPSAPSQSYLADRTIIKDAERDATYLNIKENQFGGKMQTWFAYASSLIKEGYAFDYVVKADSDTMLYPEEFFIEVNQIFPLHPTRVYAGVAVSRYHCGKKEDEHCNQMIDDYYMGGAAEIVSADLVHHVASLPAEKRRQLEINNHEDITIGNFVLSHPDPVTKLELGKQWGYKVRRRRLWVPVLWRHDKKTKQPGKWFAKFFEYEKDIRRKDPTFDNIMILPTSAFSEQIIGFAVKAACVNNRKAVVEYCAMRSFSGKKELYLSRLTTDIVAVDAIDGNSSLTFREEPVDMFKYPEHDMALQEEEKTDDGAEDDAENKVDDVPDEKEEEETSKEDIKVQTWKENIVIAVRNPIDDHLKEWLKVIQPNNPIDNMAIESKNVDALKQLEKSSVKNIYVVRLEHLWEDIITLERTLGNPEAVDPTDWPALSDPIVDIIAHAAHKPVLSRKMCCQLRHEIAAYYDLLYLGQNLQGPSIQSSRQETLSVCGASSISDLANLCEGSDSKI